MKAIKMNSKSWHYKIATNFGSYRSWGSGSGDFCDYVRNFILGLFMLSIFCGLGLVALYFLVRLLWSGYTCWISRMFGTSMACTFGNPEQITLGIVVFACFALLFIKGVTWLIEYEREKKHAQQIALLRGEISHKDVRPGFIVSAYRSIKEKTCYRIEFEEKE